MNRRNFFKVGASAVAAAVFGASLGKGEPWIENEAWKRERFSGNLTRHVVKARVTASREISQNSAIKFAREVERKIAAAMARNIESAIINGTRK